MSANTITIGAFEAKTKFSELLERVGKGVSFTITKHNKPVAKIVAPEEDEARRRIEATEKMIALSKGCRLNGLKIKDLIEEGRKW